jgi:AI-2 transport protein TqsA
MLQERRRNPGAHYLGLAASAVIVVGGLKLGQPVLVPFALALFLAVMSMPLMFWLRKQGSPAFLAILGTVLVTAGLFVLMILLASRSAADFGAQYPRYEANLTSLFNRQVMTLETWLVGAGFLTGELRDFLTLDLLDLGAIFGVLGGTAANLAGRVAGFLSTSFVVFLVLVFILAEATVFPFKARAVMGQQPGDGRRITKVVREVQEYLVIKTVTSLATGLLIGLLAWVMDLDFPVLLGLVGFVFNYIPTVGSIIAAFPAILLSMVIHTSLMHALGVAGGYLVINTIFGNIIEPQLMGRRLGLSTLVVILSLLFWAWVWGPIGAILSVPLTMILKIMCENTEDLKWVAILLDKSPPQANVTGPAPASDDPRMEPSDAESRPMTTEDGPPTHEPEVA